MDKRLWKQIGGNALTGVLVLLCAGLGGKYFWTAWTQADWYYACLGLVWLALAGIWGYRLIKEVKNRDKTEQ